MWKDDDELFGLMRGRLFPAVVGDILDTMGFLHQFLPPAIKPVSQSMVIVGRAMPVLESNSLLALGTRRQDPIESTALWSAV